MNQATYKKHNGKWFEGKKAIANQIIRNNGGQVIEAGETVTIHGKNGRGGFNITSDKKIYIIGVGYEKIDISN